MAYVDIDYYDKTFHGEPVEETDFPSLEARAAEIIEELTIYRVNAVSFLNMGAVLQDIIKRAICAQIEYIDSNGGEEFDNGGNIQSAALGKFNYSVGIGTDSSGSISKYSSRAIRILAPTGLLYRGGRI